jgi:hypothetical protein
MMDNNARHDSAIDISRTPLAFAASLLGIMFFSAFLSHTEAHAQTNAQGLEHAPPVMKFIPNEDRARLEQETDVKKRIRISLELAEARLERASLLTASERFDAAATEIGVYQALLEESLRFLERKKEVSNSGKVSDKFRDIYKRFELTLRAHGPRLETIRRSTPFEDAVNIRAAYEFTRQARADALNSFYGQTVLREVPDEKEKAAGDTSKGHGTASAPAPPDKPQQD